MSDATSQDPVAVPVLTEAADGEGCAAPDVTLNLSQTADEVVENFFEGLDEDSFIAELQVVSAWGDSKSSEPKPPDPDPSQVVETPLNAKQESGDSPSYEMPLKSDKKTIPVLTLCKKPTKNKVPNFKEKESALDRFKSFLPNEGETSKVKSNKRYQPVNYIPIKPEKAEPKTDLLGVRRDPNKTKRDIERDKQIKNKETLIKKMETGLIPPGMEMEVDNSQTVASIKQNAIKKRKDISPPKKTEFRINFSTNKEDIFRHDFQQRPRFRKKSPILRSPSFSPKRNDRHDRFSSHSSRSSRPKYERISRDRFSPRSRDRRSPRSRDRRSPQSRDRRSPHSRSRKDSPFKRRKKFRSRSREKYRKSRASIEMELLASVPVKYPVRTTLPSMLYPPPPIPVPAPSYTAPYPAPTYPIDANSFSLDSTQQIPMNDNIQMNIPSDMTSQDYFTSGYQEPYTVPFNPEVMPPEPYSNEYPQENAYSVPPATDTTYSSVKTDNYIQQTTSYLTDTFLNPYIDPLEKNKVIRNCEKAVAELNKPHLPTHVYPSISDTQQTETLSNTIDYSSPLNRDVSVNYTFNNSKRRNGKLLLPVITSTLRNDVGITINNDYGEKKSTIDAGVQTTCFSCDHCQLKGAFRQEDKGVNTMHRIFMKSVYSQVTEEDLASSKIVFTPNQKSITKEDSKPVSLTHMTPAQILAELTAKTKSMQRSAVDTYRQSGGNIDDASQAFKRSAASVYQKSNILTNMNKAPGKKITRNNF